MDSYHSLFLKGVLKKQFINLLCAVVLDGVDVGFTVVMTLFVVVGTVRVILDVVEADVVDVLGLNVVAALLVVGKLVVVSGTCEAGAVVDDPLQALNRFRRCLNNIFST